MTETLRLGPQCLDRFIDFMASSRFCILRSGHPGSHTDGAGGSWTRSDALGLADGVEVEGELASMIRDMRRTPVVPDATTPETPQDRRQGDNTPSRDSVDPPGGSQGHSEALTARVAAVIADEAGCEDCGTRASYTQFAAASALDLLAAEGRLCEPGAPERFNELRVEYDEARACVMLAETELALTGARLADEIAEVTAERDEARAEVDRLDARIIRLIHGADWQRSLLREIAIARRGASPDVHREYEDLPDEIRGDHNAWRREHAKVESLTAEVERLRAQLDEARAEVVHVRSLLAESQRIAKAATDGWTRSAAQNPAPDRSLGSSPAWRKAGRA